MALARTNVPAHRGRFGPDQVPSGYGPADLQSAYNLPSATAGSGQTVAVVDAGDDATAEADLAVYRAQYGLPQCTTANGCFEKVNQEGQQGNYPPSAGWEPEEALDVDMVSAICPLCRIILVEANSESVTDLSEAEDEAVALGAKYVSNSWGAYEGGDLGLGSSETQYDQYYNHPGVVITAATGDFGYYGDGNGTFYPAASQYATSVGGTTLTLDSSVPRGWTETAWGSTSISAFGAGSGCSLYEAKPSWQHDSGCANRMTADVSAVADPLTGVAAYDTSSGGWGVTGGTSAATPIIASVYALAGPPVPGSYPASYPYGAASALNDVTSGANGTCEISYFCTAGPAYDGPTGLGTPDGVAAFTTAHGDITGRVTDQATGAPVAGATVSLAQGYSVVTDSSGDYDLHVSPGSYDLTVRAFGYKTGSVAGVTVSDGQSVTENFPLAAILFRSVSGTVSDGSGHGWPLYAKITVLGTPVAPVYTNPYTGAYSVSLPGRASYQLQVTPVSAGYQTRQLRVHVGSAGAQQNIKVFVDPAACDAPGYAMRQSGCGKVPGGLVTGQVTDANTGDAVDGVTVASAASPAGSAVTADAPGAGNGFYELFAAGTGTQQFTATDDRYVPASAAVAVAGNAVTRQDFTLDAGRITVSPGSVSATVGLGNSAARTVTFTNTGTAPATITSLAGEDNGFTSMGFRGAARAAGAPVERVKLHLDLTPAAVPHMRPGPGGQRQAPRAAGAAWSSVANYPFPVTGNAVAYDNLDGKIYSVGGGIPSGPTSAAYAYDPVTQQWNQIANAPDSLKHEAAAFVNGTLYVIAGSGQNGPLNSVYGYSPAANSWSKLASLPAAVYYPGAAVLDGQIYVVGGLFGILKTSGVFRYDPASNTWTQLSDYPAGVAGLGCAGIDGKLVCAGGDGNNNTLNSTYIYNPAVNAWSQGTDMPYDDWGMAAGGANNALQIIGGVTGTSQSPEVTNQVIQYDPIANAWSALPNLNTPIEGAGASCGLYVVGGTQANGGLTSSAEVLPGYDSCGAPGWLTESRSSLELAPGLSVSVKMRLDSAGLSQPGSYTAELTAATDTPYQVTPVPVTLHVTPPRAWGKLTGTVTDAATGAPLPGATVHICTLYQKSSGNCGPVAYTLTTDTSGSYTLWLNQGYNPLQVVATIDGYQSQAKVVEIHQGAITTLNFPLTSVGSPRRR